MSFEEKIIYIKSNLKHQYSVISPVSKKIVEDFEKNNNLKLPEFYKFFVSNIALGIVSIDQNNSFAEDILSPFDFNTIYEDDDTLENPKKEFPLTKPIYNLCETDYDYYDITNGTIFLKGTGCGNGERLVVNGKAFGEIWIDEGMSNDEIYPAYKEDMSDDHFKTWINKSLNSQIKIKRTSKRNQQDKYLAIKITLLLFGVIFLIALLSNS